MSEPRAPESVRFGRYLLEPAAGRLVRDGITVPLGPQPMRVLLVLAEATGRLVTRQELRTAVWGDRHVEFDQALNFTIRKIRQALAEEAWRIETVPRRGYRFRADPVRAAAGRGRWRAAAALFAVLVLGVIVWPLFRRPEPVFAVGRVQVEGLDQAVGTTFASRLAGALARHGTVLPAVPAGSHGLRVDATLAPEASGIRVTVSGFAAAGERPVWRASIVADREALRDLPVDLAREAAAAATGLTPPGAATPVIVERTIGPGG